MTELTEIERIRYRRYINEMERALEIIRGDEPAIIKELMLEHLKMDRYTYGVIIKTVEGDLHLPQTDYAMLEWAITRELKSFRHALK
jgi:hypothetical protein